jgi:hypothetical protein
LPPSLSNLGRRSLSFLSLNPESGFLSGLNSGFPPSLSNLGRRSLSFLSLNPDAGFLSGLNSGLLPSLLNLGRRSLSLLPPENPGLKGLFPSGLNPPEGRSLLSLSPDPGLASRKPSFLKSGRLPLDSFPAPNPGSRRGPRNPPAGLVPSEEPSGVNSGLSVWVFILFRGGLSASSPSLSFFKGNAPEGDSGREEVSLRFGEGTEESVDAVFRPRGEEGRLSFKELKFGVQK